MSTLKNILFYFIFVLAMSGYMNYEFSDSFLLTGTTFETQDTQSEPESRECEEKSHAEEYAQTNSPELPGFYFLGQEECGKQPNFISFEYKPVVWTPPKHA